MTDVPFIRFTAFLTLLLAAGFPQAKGAPTTLSDIEYARVDDTPLLLDLYLPNAADAPSLIVWIHGGAWRSGSRKDPPILGLLEKGWTIASIDYRLSTQARFPAQIHDIKAAIRYLRANPDHLDFDPTRIVVMGSSAGGHLAALAGVSNRHADLEGTVGDHLDQDSSIQAIVSLFGASDLTTILAQSTPHGLDVRVPALELLLGAQPDEAPELARLASPVFQVDADDPPLLLLHGDQDPQMPINQAHELQGRYEALGLVCRFEVVHGAGHGGAVFTDAEHLALIDAFLRQNL